MLKLLQITCFIMVGFALGWYLKPEAVLQAEKVVINKVETATQETGIEDINPNTSHWIAMFSDSRVLSNEQVGLVAELLKPEMDLEERIQVNSMLVQYASDVLKSNKNFYSSEKKLIALLGNSEIKPKVLDFLARLYEKNSRYLEAINTLYDLKELTHYTDEFIEIGHRIDFLANKNIEQLEDSHSWDRLDAFFGYIVHKEPDNYDYQFKYAEFLYKNKNYGYAAGLLEVLVYHHDFEEKANRLLERIKHQQAILESGEFPVPVTKNGEHYLVSAIINGQEPVKLILDTGASITVLAPEVMRGLGIGEEEVLEFVNFSTANGVVNAPIVLVDKIKVQNYVVSDVKVGILPSFSQSIADGLLGMNFLNQFTFFIDQENSTLELSTNRNR